MIGEITQENLYLLLPSKVSWLVGMIKDGREISIADAVKHIYTSAVYKKLEQENTKMWHLGPVDLYNEMGSE